MDDGVGRVPGSIADSGEALSYFFHLQNRRGGDAGAAIMSPGYSYSLAAR
jgi:hypothetical protein